jgi:predicted nucleic acid-binding protein
MADYFFDTSALVKRHVIEAGSAWVRSLVHARAAHDLYIARITAVEVTSAITRRQHGGFLSRPQADAMLGHFRRHMAQRYHVIELTPSLFDAAMQTARKHRLRAYDAVQLAAALDLHQRHQDAGLGSITLISADQPLNTAALAEGLAVEDPSTRP